MNCRRVLADCSGDGELLSVEAKARSKLRNPTVPAKSELASIRVYILREASVVKSFVQKRKNGVGLANTSFTQPVHAGVRHRSLRHVCVKLLSSVSNVSGTKLGGLVQTQHRDWFCERCRLTRRFPVRTLILVEENSPLV